MDGINVDTERTKVVRDFPRPRDFNDLLSYLGMTNYFRRFIKGYAHIAQPLNLTAFLSIRLILKSPIKNISVLSFKLALSNDALSSSQQRMLE